MALGTPVIVYEGILLRVYCWKLPFGILVLRQQDFSKMKKYIEEIGLSYVHLIFNCYVAQILVARCRKIL